MITSATTTQTESPEALAKRFGLQFADLTNLEVDIDLIREFPVQELFRESVLPLARDGRRVQVAVSDPLALEVLDTLTAASGFFLDAVMASAEQIQQKLKESLGVGGGTVSDLVAMSDDVADLMEAADGGIEDASQASSVVKLVNELLLEAVKQRASDVHIEPDEDSLDVRFRVDGILRVQPMPPEILRFRAAIVSRLKIMAKLNIAEKRLPQDGRIKLTVQGRDVDVRISVVPLLHGESIVMRLLDTSRACVSLDAIEFPNSLREQWESLIGRSHGLVLVTGPTGSGKTTTLYSSLVHVRSPKTKIITVEDPVEYNLKGITQIQVQNQIGLNFAAGLRSILRHDPDVVLIGEIRDGETATSAIQAALTGHLVLSTLHTNDASSAITRLIDMGIEPFMVASVLEGVLAQRLVRRLCESCREPYSPRQENLPADLPLANVDQLFRAVGCRDCHHTGYLGRIAIFELMPADRTIRQLCTQRASAAELRAHAVQSGMTSLRQCGWQRVLAGQTSVDELLRVCASADE